MIAAGVPASQIGMADCHRPFAAEPVTLTTLHPYTNKVGLVLPALPPFLCGWPVWISADQVYRPKEKIARGRDLHRSPGFGLART